MPAPLTPFDATQSYLVATTLDTALQAYAQIYPTATTAFAASVNQTGEAMFGGRPIISTVKYSLSAVASSVYAQIGISSGVQVTVTTVRSSAPIVATAITHYYQIIPSNATVFNVFNSAVSLLQTTGSYDIKSFTDSVVAGTEA